MPAGRRAASCVLCARVLCVESSAPTFDVFVRLLDLAPDSTARLECLLGAEAGERVEAGVDGVDPEEARFLFVAADCGERIGPDGPSGRECDPRVAARSLVTSTGLCVFIGVPGSRRD